MITAQKASLPVLGFLAAVALSGCSLLSPAAPAETAAPTTAPVTPAITADDLNDTTWTGTDSQGTVTTFVFHEGGSTAVTFGDNPYDDPADTWTLDGSSLEISIKNVEGVGDATYTGEVTSATDPIDLDLTFSLDTTSRTLTITPQ